MAPGEEPGAMSVPMPGHAGQAVAPSGIVRLVDLLPGAAAAREGAGKRTASGAAYPQAPAADDQPGRDAGPRGPSAAGVRHPLARAGARQDTRGRRDEAGNTPQARADLPGDQAASAPPADGAGVGSEDEGPGYESLFGPQGESGRRSRRERPPATAMQRALGLLTRREHSRKELTRKLVSRGVDAAEVEAAVDKLTAAGWQDERRFAENLVRARASAGYGPLHIRAELATHDLPADVRAAALEAFDGDWAEVASDLVRRRFGRLDDARARERKAVDLLIRRGFPGDVARSAARSIPDGD